MTPAFYTLHTRAHHEMDNNYHNHILPGAFRAYISTGCVFLGLLAPPPRLARHVFQATTTAQITAFAEVIGNGAVSMLVNLDPTARLTCYYLSKNGEYRTVPVMVGDKYFCGYRLFWS